MVYTVEQLEIIFNDSPRNLFVEARAGTGKTTVLEAISKENFVKKILLLTFNKGVRKSAKIKMPINVESHTINSFAYKYYLNGILSKKLSGEKILVTESLTSHFVATRYLKDLRGHEAIIFADKIVKSFNDKMDFNINLFESEAIENIVKKIVSDMKSKTIPITHNFILRDFAKTFDFSTMEYDYIIVDEAQDANKVMLDIIYSMKTEKKVFVGDPLQSIYGFRGNVNIFEEESLLDESDKMSLTGSFRMGQTIADFIKRSTSYANNQEIEFHGLNKVEGEIFESTVNPDLDRFVLITRTNANLFDQAFSYARKGKNVSIPFEWDKIKSLIESVFYLRMGMIESIESEHIKMYGSFQNFQRSIESGTDIELKFLLKIIDKHGLSTLDNVKILERQLSSNKYADVICITAHKAKGLEFENVRIAEDFVKYRPLTQQEEKNLVYVAMTRASEKLILNEDLTKLYRRLS